jgi:hypothetical protein
MPVLDEVVGAMRFLCNFLTATAVSNLLDSCNENLRKEFILRKYALISVSTPLTSFSAGLASARVVVPLVAETGTARCDSISVLLELAH